MKSIVILSTAALVYAQADSTGYFPGEPSCALPCLSSAITAAGCQLSDIGCQCGPTQAVIGEKVAGCIITSCTKPTDFAAAVGAGQAVCSSFFAGELSFTTPSVTNPGGPIQTPTPSSGTSGSASGSSIVMTNPPTPTSTPTFSSTASDSSSGSDSDSSGSTHTDTLIGSSTPNLSGSLTAFTSLTPTSTPTGAAATPGKLGAGILAGIMGAAALL
ncbi:hypothetical protein F4777DRAFT_526528 [Nemania sp. FL0916]|nr:hypothetical protein F4777DRAFT_526528 [Nemania sp. FL0916]